jgi:hypothetical protein
MVVSTSDQTPLTLPFYVNAPGNYVKSGFMGDAQTSVLAAPSAQNSDGTCGGNRASASAGGDCDTFQITPASDGMGWQGVFYQFPAGNWGTSPGRAIAPDASAVTFSARASRAVAVKFQVGMCDAAHASDATQCADGFFAFPTSADSSDNVMVSSEWTQFSISLSGTDYSSGVRGAFSWVVVDSDLGADTSELSLYVDDLAWM